MPDLPLWEELLTFSVVFFFSHKMCFHPKRACFPFSILVFLAFFFVTSRFRGPYSISWVHLSGFLYVDVGGCLEVFLSSVVSLRLRELEVCWRLKLRLNALPAEFELTAKSITDEDFVIYMNSFYIPEGGGRRGAGRWAECRKVGPREAAKRPGLRGEALPSGADGEAPRRAPQRPGRFRAPRVQERECACFERRRRLWSRDTRPDKGAAATRARAGSLRGPSGFAVPASPAATVFGSRSRSAAPGGALRLHRLETQAGCAALHC